ncbi:unnamed protein product, partial [Porites evermanni]
FILTDEELLKHYFDLGFSYSEIWAFLAFAHGIYFRKHKSSARESLCTVNLFYRYSRRIMWLEVRSTNNDAAVIADHFLVCTLVVILLISGTARIVPADPGTENVKVEVLQKIF